MMFTKILIFVFSSIFLLGLAFADSKPKEELISSDIFQERVLSIHSNKNEKALTVWHQFRDFDKLLTTFTSSEKKDYEWAQRAVLMSDQRDENVIKDYDLMAFKRAYPHLAKALNFKDVERSFFKHYQEKYSYGWRRRLAWFDRRLANPGTVRNKRFSDRVFLDQSRSYLQQKQGVLPNRTHFLALGLDQLLSLAICDGYKPAVLDVMKVARLEEQLKLSPTFSSLLMLRAKQVGFRPFHQKSWQAEIDQTVSAKEQQTFRELIKDKDQLYKTLDYCSY